MVGAWRWRVGAKTPRAGDGEGDGWREDAGRGGKGVT